jgi:hypothetical protein
MASYARCQFASKSTGGEPNRKAYEERTEALALQAGLVGSDVVDRETGRLGWHLWLMKAKSAPKANAPFINHLHTGRSTY